LDVLSGGVLRYSPLSAFNDPFEGRPEITEFSTVEEMTPYLHAALEEEFKKLYGGRYEEMRAAVSDEQWQALIVQLSEAASPNVQKLLQIITQQIPSFLTNTLDKQLGVLSLSEASDSLLMWSHYGVGHTGFALEFDTHHAHFHEQICEEDEFRHLRRVVYRKARPSAPMTSLDGGDMFLVKSLDWEYEGEWRIMRPLAKADSVLDAQPHPIHLFRFPPTALKAVIIGSRATEGTIDAILDILKTTREYSHVAVKKASPDPTHFLLRIGNY
jgi:hypothetical protein